MQRVQRRRRGRVAREEGVHVERRDGHGLGGVLSTCAAGGGREKDGRIKAEALANVASVYLHFGEMQLNDLDQNYFRPDLLECALFKARRHRLHINISFKNPNVYSLETRRKEAQANQQCLFSVVFHTI